MLSNRDNISRSLKKVAASLGEWNDKAVYVGGAIVYLYVDDPGAEDIRPTKDIDLFFEISTKSDLDRLQKSLVSKGFQHDMNSPLVCRFLIHDIIPISIDFDRVR